MCLEAMGIGLRYATMGHWVSRMFRLQCRPMHRDRWAGDSKNDWISRSQAVSSRWGTPRIDPL